MVAAAAVATAATLYPGTNQETQMQQQLMMMAVGSMVLRVGRLACTAMAA
jgi:hypothetical protein